MVNKTDQQKFENKYRDELWTLYESYAVRLRTLIEEITRKTSIAIAQIEHRAKTVDSFLGKLESKGYENPLVEIKDFCGIRLITYYQDDVARLASLISQEFNVDKSHSSDKSQQLDVDEFGYKSLHLVISLKEPRCSLQEWLPFRELDAEVQIRSVLQHAWASISHKLDYKVVSQAPPELRRQLFRLSALLELADDEFLSLRERTENVIERYRQEVNRGELDIPLNRDSLINLVPTICV